MNKIEFMKLLKLELETFKVRNIEEILADYEEHFTHGLSKGKSEEEISKKLGSPLTIAKAYHTEHMIEEVRSGDNGFQWRLALNVVIRLLVLAPFNFIVLFIPGVIVFSLLATGWSLSVASGLGGFFILGKIPAVIALSTTAWAAFAGFFSGITLIGVALIAIFIMFLITKYILLALIGYLQWNLKFILDK